MVLLNWNEALLPLSWLYGLGVGIRNKLFDWKILPVETFDVPVISIGNLAVGGTGKTPHTEYLIRLLSENYKVAVLSRGYKRKTTGFILADETTDNRSIGDEPYQMYRKFPDILVAVDTDRRRGIHRLLNLPKDRKPDVILLDDAFQHRYVKPSLSILLTDNRRPFFAEYLIPAGSLREPAKYYSRADVIIFTKCPIVNYNSNKFVFLCSLFEITENDDKSFFYTSIHYKNLLPVFPEFNSAKEKSIKSLKEESCSFLVLAGLAYPQDMIQYLKKYTSDLHSIVYPDHHDFSQKNIAEITEKLNAIQNTNKLIITSEKDAVRLMNNPHIPEEIKILMYYLPIEVVFLPEYKELFKQKIVSHVESFK